MKEKKTETPEENNSKAILWEMAIVITAVIVLAVVGICSMP